jgi:Zn-dependent protease/predicted transcriptional regulator
MLKGGIPIGKLFGISLRLHYTWFFIFALITWSLTVVYFPTAYPAWNMAMKIGAGLLTSFLYFGSVVVHELCHSLVARREKIKVDSITLFFLGGVSQITTEAKTAGEEFRVAVAGPLSSLVLGGLFWSLYFALRNVASAPAQFVTAVSYYIGYINIFLGIFNLIPGFPLDGGRVFRSIIWWRTGSLQKATRLASVIGRMIGYVFILIQAFTSSLSSGIWLALIGWFLQSSAADSYSQMVIRELLKGHTAGEIMSQDCTAVAPNIPVEHFVNEIMLNSGRRCFPVVADDRAEGLITLSDVKAIPREEWSITPVRQAMTPLDKLKSVSPKEDLNTVLQILAENDINQVPVVQDGTIIGMVARDSIINFIHVKSQLAK